MAVKETTNAVSSRPITARKPVGSVSVLGKRLTTGVTRRSATIRTGAGAKNDHSVRQEVARKSSSRSRDNAGDIMAQLSTWEARDKKGREMSEEQREYLK